MFTGIIENIGIIREINIINNDNINLVLYINICVDLKVGDSLSIDGVCLTIKENNNEIYHFDVSKETLDKTIIGSYKVGNLVNVEIPIRTDSLISGHFVTGHVNCRAILKNKTRLSNGYYTIGISLENSKNMIYIFDKCSVSVNGVSLTVSETDSESGIFYIVLIPETIKSTNLVLFNREDYVNIEFDAIIQCVVNTTKYLFKNTNFIGNL